VKIVDAFMQPPPPGGSKRTGSHRGRRFQVQVGAGGADAQKAVRDLVELGRRQRIGRRLGAAAVIKAERR
jgi:hypothetical protein